MADAVDIVFTDAAVDDLRKLGPSAVPSVLKKILLLADSPSAGYPLGGELTGYRKLIVGRNTWRVVYRLVDDKTLEICEIWAVGARADAEVYAEASTRVIAAAQRMPEFTKLAEVIDRLGRHAGGVTAPPLEPAAEPVPKWLADRLIHTAGMPPEQVAALDLEAAVDRWTAYQVRGH